MRVPWASQEQAQELAWQLSELRRQTTEAKDKNGQLKADTDQALQALKEAKVTLFL